MRKVKILKICFENKIHPSNISKFRGAVIDKVGKENILFHNHIGDDKFRYKYPLIQYKTMGDKAALVCLSEGVNEVNHLFSNTDMNINLGGENIKLELSDVKVNSFVMQIWQDFFFYSIYNWIALNSENYKKYQELEGIVEKTLFLENILKGNILALADGIDLYLEEEIKLNIIEIKREKIVTYKGTKMMAFELVFKTNFFIPNHLGLGKGVSLGFGVVRKYKK